MEFFQRGGNARHDSWRDARRRDTRSACEPRAQRQRRSDNCATVSGGTRRAHGKSRRAELRGLWESRLANAEGPLDRRGKEKFDRKSLELIEGCGAVDDAG